MDIDNYAMEKKLREIMYSALGYHKKNEFWRKTKPEKKQHIKGQIQCAKCLEYFDKEFILQRKKSYYCIECEKTIV